MGQTMATIAKKYGVSRQRIKQVTQKLIPDWNEKYGFAVLRQIDDDLKYEKYGDKDGSLLYKRKRAKFRSKRDNAIRTGWSWEIEFGDLVWPTHCPILGIELDYFAPNIQENSVSFDQIDAGKGYVEGNVHIISWRANRIKNNGTAEEHRKIAEYLDSLNIAKN